MLSERYHTIFLSIHFNESILPLLFPHRLCLLLRGIEQRTALCIKQVFSNFWFVFLGEISKSGITRPKSNNNKHGSRILSTKEFTFFPKDSG